VSNKISMEDDFRNSPTDVACGLASLLYESLRQASACSAFRESLARQLGAEIQSFLHPRGDGMVATYGSVADPDVFTLQSQSGTALLPASVPSRGGSNPFIAGLA
jgi:hypothetical protein